MNENQILFAEALQKYVSNQLLNDLGWEPFAPIITGDLATVQIGMVRGGLKIIAVQVQDVIACENELKEAKKTIRTLEKHVRELEAIAYPKDDPTNPQEETVVTEVTETPKRATRKRNT